MSTIDELHLRIAWGEDRNIVVEQYYMGALRIFHPLYLDGTGQATYYVVNPGGGYPDGNPYLTKIEVLQGTSAVLITQMVTKIYRTPTCPARQDIRMSLGPRAVSELVLDQVIAYRESPYWQTTLAEMDPTMTFTFPGVLAPGWTPDGSAFGYDYVRLRTDTRAGGRCAVVDNLRLTPGEVGLAGLGDLEGHSHLASFTVFNVQIDDTLVSDMAQMLEVDGVHGAVTRVQDSGFIARVLGDDTTRLTDLMLGTSKLLRGQWFGAPRLNLRKHQQQPTRLGGGYLPMLLSIGVLHT